MLFAAIAVAADASAEEVVVEEQAVVEEAAEAADCCCESGDGRPLALEVEVEAEDDEDGRAVIAVVALLFVALLADASLGSASSKVRSRGRISDCQYRLTR